MYMRMRQWSRLALRLLRHNRLTTTHIAWRRNTLLEKSKQNLEI
jgi:hypothetical protein